MVNTYANYGCKTPPSRITSYNVCYTKLLRSVAIIKGTEFRLLADAPLTDLLEVDPGSPGEKTERARIKATESLQRLRQDRQQLAERNQVAVQQWSPAAQEQAYFEVPGKVLHLDGDERYLQKSLDLYEKLRVPVNGYYVNESAMPNVLYRLLPTVNPDIVVLTGHDGVLKNPPSRDRITSYNVCYTKLLRILCEFCRKRRQVKLAVLCIPSQVAGKLPKCV